MTTIFYTQHELKPADIRRDEAKEAAIARNRAKAATKRTPAAGTREMTEMRHFGDNASDAAKNQFERLLAQLAQVNPTVHAQAAAWWTTQRDTIKKGDISPAINRLRVRIAESGNTTPMPTPAHGVVCTHGAPYGPQCNITDQRPAYVPDTTPRDPFADVPDGYYAVDTEEGVLGFYRVSTWKRSGDRKVQVKASNELYDIKGWKAADAILEKIRRDTPEVAGKRFADELRMCWRCGRDLTDEESRARGMGSTCASKA